MRLWQLQLGIYGGASAAYGAYKSGPNRLKRTGGVDDLTQVPKKSKTGRALRGAGNLFGFGANMGSTAGVGLKSGFDKQIKGRYFNFGKAVGPYMWIIAAIDLILMFVPVVRVVDTIIQLGITLPTAIYESAQGLENNEITRYTDWSEALLRAFGQVEYDKWQEEMQTKGRSNLSLALSETDRDYEVDKTKLGAEKLLEQDVRDDYAAGNISKQLYDIMLKFARGQGRMEEIVKLDPEEKKKLFKEYMVEKDYSWILRDLKQVLEVDIRNARDSQHGYVDEQLDKQIIQGEGWDPNNPFHVIGAGAVSLFTSPSGDKVEEYLLNDIKHAERIFKSGEVAVGYETVYLTAREKFIMYHFLMGNDSWLQKADQSTKDKFDKAGLVVEDGETGMFQPGPASAQYAKESMAAEMENFGEAQGQLKQYMATAGHGQKLDRVNEIERNVLSYGNVDMKPSEKAEKVKDPEPVKLNFGYRVVNSGWAWAFGTFHDLDSQDHLTLNDPRYEGVKIKSVFDPATGKRYMLKREIEAHEFFANPMAFQNVLPDGVYVNKNGSIFFGNPNSTKETDTAKEVVEQHDERYDIQEQMLDFYSRNKEQEDSKAVYTPKSGGSVAGGTNLNTQYIKAGKASIAGGNRMKK